MSTRRALIVAAVGICIASAGKSALAQGGPSNFLYTPPPTVSPYLNLFNNPNGVGTYQTLVRPFLNQYDINARQTANVNQLQQELNQVRSNSGLGTTGTQGRIRPTGHAATFMDYSHYFAQQRR